MLTISSTPISRTETLIELLVQLEQSGVPSASEAVDARKNRIESFIETLQQEYSPTEQMYAVGRFIDRYGVDEECILEPDAISHPHHWEAIISTLLEETARQIITREVATRLGEVSENPCEEEHLRTDGIPVGDGARVVAINPLKIIHELATDTLEALQEAGATLGDASLDELAAARAEALGQLLHTDRDPFGDDLLAITYTLQVTADEYGIREVQEPAQFPECATSIEEILRSGVLYHHLEAAITAELSGDTHGHSPSESDHGGTDAIRPGPTLARRSEVTTYGYGDAGDEPPLPLEDLLLMHDTPATSVGGPDRKGVQWITDIIGFVKRVDRETPGGVEMGFIAREFHEPDLIIVEGFTIHPTDEANEDAIPVDIQRDVYDQHRTADVCIATGDEISVWYD